MCCVVRVVLAVSRGLVSLLCRGGLRICIARTAIAAWSWFASRWCRSLPSSSAPLSMRNGMSWSIVKPASPAPSEVSLPHIVCGDFASKYPATAAYWWSSAWPDGKLKKPATVRFSVYQGKLQMTFSLIGTGLMLRIDLEDPILAWDALEALLGLVNVPWQTDPFNAADGPLEPKKGRKRGG